MVGLVSWLHERSLYVMRGDRMGRVVECVTK
jgi:hypothetical protein